MTPQTFFRGGFPGQGPTLSVTSTSPALTAAQRRREIWGPHVRGGGGLSFTAQLRRVWSGGFQGHKGLFRWYTDQQCPICYTLVIV